MNRDLFVYIDEPGIFDGKPERPQAYRSPLARLTMPPPQPT
jgi:hypothetical protein